ncbi:MAG: LysR family transcriptional regulator [Alteromonadaceae bacterium TMED7]|nr:LysR family transcriptional regulator [Alteromonadaceae bacterium]MCP4865867.1 LysR family transcriptional regulator [Alteromonas sp.]RPH17902.1 MAG: LysR family transcriptional regulator [Alteromonadaceae bacterium TMED7]
MDKLKAMKVFVEIADMGSLTAAANSLETSLTSVVRTLAALEDHLKVRLFNRNTRQIAITDEGREYYLRCRTILAEVNDAESMLIDRQAEPLGKVTVTAPVTFGKRHVAPKINAYLNQYQKMQVNLVLLDRPVDMLSEGIDIALRIGRIGNHDLVARQLGSMRHVLCASPDFMTGQTAPEQPQDIAGQPCIHLSVLDNPEDWHFQHGIKLMSVAMQSRLIANQVDAALDACIAGVGYCRFLHYQVSDAVKRGDLQILLPDYEPHPLPVHLLYAPVKLQTKRLRSMTDWLTQSLQQDLTVISQGDKP